MTELERFKTILATICLEHEDIKLGEALLIAADIEKRMLELPLGGLTMLQDPQTFNGDTPHSVIDAWLRTQADIKSLAKINGIKEIRARTSLSLLDAKRAWERVFVSVT